MTREQEGRSPAVPETAKQGEETKQQREDRWGFVEPAIWTERMIAALVTGVKGGKWFSLQHWPNAPLDAERLFTTDRSPEGGRLSPMRERPTGEPDAGDPHVRFGGEGASAPLPNQKLSRWDGPARSIGRPQISGHDLRGSGAERRADAIRPYRAYGACGGLRSEEDGREASSASSAMSSPES
jgi:hypothetical protein